MNEATITIIISVAFGVVALISTLISYYFHIREKIGKAASGAIDSAEESGKVGAEKFEKAVEQLNALIPAVLKPFFSDTVVRKLVQETFESIESYAKKQHKKG